MRGRLGMGTQRVVLRQGHIPDSTRGASFVTPHPVGGTAQPTIAIAGEVESVAPAARRARLRGGP